MTTRRTLLGGLFLALATAGAWVAWLSWESGWTVDPQTGDMSGPYAVWQVAAAVLTLGALAAVAGWWLNIWLVATVMTVAFTVPWAVHAASTDDTGLWAVGAALVAIGTTIGTTLVGGSAGWLRRRTG
ncbi:MULTISPECIES: hypothetical protein [Micromonospora]|uniref:Uncharacterized protein n=1 Tax=Micromonospora chalcea TaxID=1874 RepID=A0ABX9Y5R1_MICCH|nr:MULTISPECIES: hypothetical protein [Micromonospora]ODB77591.1 hypothetical protein A8711_04020 [Micromonospora sp. II]RQW94186.1 hypothetical protein DLJ60_10040 [Micromonospora chalcea]RQX27969.1 hypothetical protein DLJ57_22655 [Micromonospora chalcea]